MFTTVKNYLDAERARREESGEDGFSLIELIIVVVILGVLALVAIPVFLGIQAQAEQSALDAVAGNAASQAAAAIAQGNEPTFGNLEQDGVGITMSGSTLDDFCVTATKEGLTDALSGPGCTGGTGGDGE